VSRTKACHDLGTDEGGNRVTAVQRSAEGVVGGGNEPGLLEQELWAADTGGLTLPKARTVPFPEGRVNGVASRTRAS